MVLLDKRKLLCMNVSRVLLSEKATSANGKSGFDLRNLPNSFS